MRQEETSYLQFRIPTGLHASTKELVCDFAEAMAAKLYRSEQKYGYSDAWLRNHWEDECRKKMREHISKGDPIDVANYCAFMWRRGWSTTTRPEIGAESLIEAAVEAIEAGSTTAPVAETLRAALRILRLEGDQHA